MAIEKNGQMTYVDEAGNEYLLFPKTKIPQVEGLEAALAGKAPAGYGLGLTSGAYVDDCDKATAFGLYSVSYATANNPLNAYGALLALPHNETEKSQILISSYTKGIVIRHENGGVWGEWEWDNPPMSLGVEYRTTERFNDKVVYAKAVDCGTVAQGTSYVQYSNGSGEFPISVVATLKDDTSGWCDSIPHDNATVSISGYRIKIDAVGTVPNLRVYATAKYTKN